MRVWHGGYRRHLEIDYDSASRRHALPPFAGDRLGPVAGADGDLDRHQRAGPRTRFELATTAGSAIGTSTFLVIGAFGLAPVLAVIAPWYDVLRWLGAAYLVYLGVKQFRAAPAAAQAPRRRP